MKCFSLFCNLLFVLDFAVGAYKSGHVAIIKSRRVIEYESSFRTNVTTIGLDARGFNITACLRYEGKYAPATTGKFLCNTSPKITLL